MNGNSRTMTVCRELREGANAVAGRFEARPGAQRLNPEVSHYGCPRYRTFPIGAQRGKCCSEARIREEELDAAMADMKEGLCVKKSGTAEGKPAVSLYETAGFLYSAEGVSELLVVKGGYFAREFQQ